MRRLITSGACAAAALLGYSAFPGGEDENNPDAVVALHPVLSPTKTTATLVAVEVPPEPEDAQENLAFVEGGVDRSAPLSRAELERRARAVEEEANRELQRLVRTLGLSQEQQDYVFAALAQTSPLYGGPMQVDSGNAAALAVAGLAYPDLPREERVYELLDPDQQDAYAEDILDRQAESEAWWKELVEEIEADLTGETPALPVDPSEVAPEPVPEIPVEGKSKSVTDLNLDAS